MLSVFCYETDIGALVIEDNGKALQRLYLPGENPGSNARERETPLTKKAGKQLLEYLAGSRAGFDLPLHLSGSPFQVLVWQALAEIPRGETRSYGQIAAVTGRPRAARAVGQACRRNPLPIFIPCHRVIGSSGCLTGFGGGLNLKERLLQLEKNSFPSDDSFR